MKEDSKTSSFFDDYDEENGYKDEELDVFELTDILYNIYDFAISEQHMNFESCENMDFIAYLNYLDYLFNRKAGKEVEHEC